MINSANEVSRCGFGTFAPNHLNDRSDVSAIDSLLIELKCIANGFKKKKKKTAQGIIDGIVSNRIDISRSLQFMK